MKNERIYINPTTTKVTVECYDKCGERHDIRLTGTLNECDKAASRKGFVIYIVWMNGIECEFDYTERAFFYYADEGATLVEEKRAEWIDISFSQFVRLKKLVPYRYAVHYYSETHRVISLGNALRVQLEVLDADLMEQLSDEWE